MRKKNFMLAAAVLLISFLCVYILSPGKEEYQARYSEDNFIKISDIEVPEKTFEIDYRDNIPTDVLIKQANVKNIEVWVSNTIHKRQIEYLKQNLKCNLEFPEGNMKGDLVLSVKDLVLYMGEDWMITRAFSPFNEIFSDKYPLFMVILPENVIYMP